MLLPAWAVFGLLAASLSAAMMLTQEKLKVEGFALAIWCKIACIVFTFPFVLMQGLPTNPLFYAFLALQAAIFAINDVILFRNIPVLGAGIISRLMPTTIIFGFFLWFVIDPSLISQYAANPLISLLIISVLGLATWFAMRLKECHISMQAVRILWFVILANTLGPIIAKLVTNHADIHQGPLAFTFVEAWMMIALWMAYLLVARPVPISSLFVRKTWIGGMIIGAIMAAMIIVHVTGFYYIDNPGYISAIKLVDAVMIVGAHKLTGKNDGSDIRSGIGIVVCAIALIILKSQI